MRLRIGFVGLELAAAAGAVRQATQPLDEKRSTGKWTGRAEIAAALRASAQNRVASNSLALLVGNLENEIACGVFTDQITIHNGQPPQSQNGSLAAFSRRQRLVTILSGTAHNGASLYNRAVNAKWAGIGNQGVSNR